MPIPHADRSVRTSTGQLKCSTEGCPKRARPPSDECGEHAGRGRCVVRGCSTIASGRGDKCRSHLSVGRAPPPYASRCSFAGCHRFVPRSTPSGRCSYHGGHVRPCVVEGCSKLGSRAGRKCYAHSSASERPCEFEGRLKTARREASTRGPHEVAASSSTPTENVEDAGSESEEGEYSFKSFDDDAWRA